MALRREQDTSAQARGVTRSGSPPTVEVASAAGLGASIGNQAFGRAARSRAPAPMRALSRSALGSSSEWVGLERQLARTAALRRLLARDRFDRNEPAPAPSTPDAGDSATKLAETKKKTENMIKLARDSGRRYAADNLEHWYQGSGTPVVMPAAAFTGEKFLLDHLKDVHGKRLSLGAENRVKDGRLKAGQSVTMTWKDSVNAPIDRELFYALGGFTVESTMDVTATTIPEDPSGMLLITVTRWSVKCSDEYNFDPGKTAYIPGVGQVTDAEMDTLRAAGLAKNFHVDSAPFDALALLGGKIEYAIAAPKTAGAGASP
jgi:hypothetical protein